LGGLFRLVCTNGMVVSEGRCETVRVPHKGDIMGQVIEGSFKVLEHSADALAAAGEWQGVRLSPDEQRAFAETAHALRFGDAEGEAHTPIRPEQLLQPRRSADAAPDLWHTFNRVQEQHFSF
jgi:threonine synthase